MKLTLQDHKFCLKACADSRATDEEKLFLSTMASLYGANEDVSRSDYLRMQALTGGALSLTVPIFDRQL